MKAIGYKRSYRTYFLFMKQIYIIIIYRSLTFYAMYATSVNELTKLAVSANWHFNKYFIYYWCYELICMKGYCIIAKKFE